MTLVPDHITDPLEPSPAPPADDPNAASSTVNSDGPMLMGGPQSGDTLTTSQGTRLRDSDHSLKAGRRGPTLLEDHHLREKITHFDHERIPERVVHARGAAAHGAFVSNGAGSEFCRAGLFSTDAETPVFVRFSTVVGSRGSADTVRDTRGFAVKFYSDEGTWDLVGNNMPVFFIQDGIKFPDIIHAAKPHPDVEIPQAQSAHDTFWDFVSLHTEATHHMLWAMSDRGIPRSYRMMEGFGVHTFRLINAEGATSLVKFHWKPVAGVHSLIWEEAQIASGFDPDFHRRDLAEAINAGNLPEWELGFQVMPDSEDETFEGIDLLDPTKMVPEELAPVTMVGTLTLNRNPANYFAETEQVAFHTGHLVPGIEATHDPLLQARQHSYLDTQISRLGGVNFSQLPINRPRAEVNDNLRDGQHQTQVHTGVAAYTPNTLGGGCPFPADLATAYLETPTPTTGVKERAVPQSFDDHITQPAMFYRSLSAIEQQHLADAIAFELAKVHDAEIRQRELEVLARVDTDLATAVALPLGLPVPAGEPVGDGMVSAALSQHQPKMFPPLGRAVGIVVTGDAPIEGFDSLDAAAEQGISFRFIAPTGAPLTVDDAPAAPERTYATARSIEFDAVILVGSEQTPLDPRMAVLLQETFRHCKPIVIIGAQPELEAIGVLPDAPGIIVSSDMAPTVIAELLDLMGGHRVWDRLTGLDEAS